MKGKGNYFIFFILLKFSISIGFSQESIIKFSFCKTSLDKEARVLLDSIGIGANKEETKIYHIGLINFSCEEELKQKPQVGALRAIEIINYLEKNHNLKRERFYYIDSHVKRISKGTCKTDTKGISVMLIK